MRSIIKKKRIAQSSLNWEDSEERFRAFKERSTYMAGWIQGAEYILNYVEALAIEESALQKEIKQIEKQLKKKD